MYSKAWKTKENEIIDFIRDNKQIILNHDLDRLYEISTIDNYDLTGFLLACGIDPLKYLTRIPNDFFWAEGADYELIIPENIKSIGMHAFSYNSFKSIIVEGNIESIASTAFLCCHIDDKLVFKGDVENITDGAFLDAQGTIVCFTYVKEKIERSVQNHANIMFREL